MSGDVKLPLRATKEKHHAWSTGEAKGGEMRDCRQIVIKGVMWHAHTHAHLSCLGWGTWRVQSYTHSYTLTHTHTVKQKEREGRDNKERLRGRCRRQDSNQFTCRHHAFCTLKYLDVVVVSEMDAWSLIYFVSVSSSTMFQKWLNIIIKLTKH